MPRKPFINNTEFPYHVGARCINRDWFALDMDQVWEIMIRHLYFLHYGFGLKIHSFVLMSNHFHMLASSPEGNLSQAMQYFMKATGTELRFLSSRINQTYGGRFHRTVIKDPRYFMHAYKYIYRNPVAAGLSKTVEDYRYSSLYGLLGKGKLELPIQQDSCWENLAAIEENLRWLNSMPSTEDWDAIRKALLRQEFKLSRINNKPHNLEIDAL